MVQRTLSKRIYGATRLMRDLLLTLVCVVIIIAGTLLFIYGVTADPFGEVTLFRELSLTLGAGLLAGIVLLYKS